VLPDFLERIRAAGVRRVAIHARKAWLQGLSPKENRDIPPLDHDLVHRMKTEFPDLHLSLNGGIASLAAAQDHLARGIDGVMIGRAAYHTPAEILLDTDRAIFGGAAGPDRHAVVEGMRPHIAVHLAEGGKLAQVTRHMLGLFAGGAAMAAGAVGTRPPRRCRAGRAGPCAGGHGAGGGLRDCSPSLRRA